VVLDFTPELDAVLMVGGSGLRLRPLTENCPKPMLEIGGKPILEHTLENLIAAGFKRFCLAVHYKAEAFYNYFQDGRKWGVSIEYLHEEKRLGTAGALGLLGDKVTKSTLVMNGDLVTDANFTEIVAHHQQCQAVATMCVVPYEIQLPYGIVEIDGNLLSKVCEKPVLQAYANAGIYVLNPSVISRIPKGEHFDMPQLFNCLRDEEQNTVAYVIKGQWTDVGDLKELERVRSQYSRSIDEVVKPLYLKAEAPALEA
jgi:NDP-sugar pyrophosphorylase family protein